MDSNKTNRKSYQTEFGSYSNIYYSAMDSDKTNRKNRIRLSLGSVQTSTTD